MFTARFSGRLEPRWPRPDAGHAARVHAMAPTRTTCPYCGVGCGVLVQQGPHGLEVEGDPDHPVNRGKLCSKGMQLHQTVMDSADRLLFPMMRSSRGAPMERVSWDAALDRTAAVFASVVERHGPEAVAFYVSGQLLTEEYYLVNRIAKGHIGTANIDTNSRLCMSSAVTAYRLALGEDCVPISYDDIEAADCFLVAGANPAWCHPILFGRIEERRRNGPTSRLIVVDPRRTDTAALADLHLQIHPGSDIVLFNAVARVLIESGQADHDFIARSTNGFADVRAAVFSLSVADAAEVCGVSTAQIALAARWIGESQGFLSLWAMGLNQSVQGVRKNLALINLNLLTGQIGKRGAGPFSLTGQPNAMGGREVGGLANMLAAHRALENAQHRLEVAQHWRVPVENIPVRSGLTAVEMFDALSDASVRAIWIICTNPAVSLPNLSQVEQALKKSRFVVVQDISRRSDSIDFADVVLPAAGWLEKQGTMTNSERRVSYLPAAVPPPGEALPDFEILRRFGEKMGWAGFSDLTPAAAYEEHALLTRGTNLDVSGLSHDRLQREGTLQWPVPSPSHPGTARLFTDGVFHTMDGRATLHGVASEANAEEPGPEFPLILTTGRVRDQWHTMTRTGTVARLGLHAPEPFLEIHPTDAQALGVTANANVAIVGRRGSFVARARLTDSIKEGVVFAPMHWGRIAGRQNSRVNNVTNPAFDPESKEPDFKFAAVRVSPVETPRRHLVVVGAGTSARAFVSALLAEGSRDRITVLGEEPTPFYNRIFLPEYISGQRSMEGLLEERPAEHTVKVLSGDRVVAIEPQERRVRLASGRTLPYDELILATGGCARTSQLLERLVPVHQLFTLRNHGDADRILRDSGERILVVGGGLLGVELADALRLAGREVIIVQRSGRLMSRQLDSVAGEMLGSVLRARGIELYLNDEVVGVREFDGRLVAYLAGGERVYCTSVVAALGTEPAVEVARAGGLVVNYGIPTDARLATATPHVHAIGECVEFANRTYGTSAAATEQAKVLARVLMGDPAAHYVASAEVNVLKVEGVELASLGVVEVDPGDEVLLESDVAAGRYRRLIVRRNRLAGAILFGDTSSLGYLRELYASRLELGAERHELLGARAAAPQVIGRLVCSCRRVGEGNIAALCRAARYDVAEICRLTGAGSGCGSCRGEVARTVRQEAQREDANEAAQALEALKIAGAVA